MSGDAHFKLFLCMLALGGAAAASFWYGFKAWRENRLVEDTPTSRVRSAAQGYVELKGRGVESPDSPIRAPLTGKPCTWWKYTIEERGGAGRSRRWSSIDGGASEEPFVLEDATGRCLVDPRGAQVFPRAREVWYGDSCWPEVHIPDGEGLLGKLADALLAGGRYRYTEYRLQPNETLCALGEYRSAAGVGAVSPDEAEAQLLRAWKHNQSSLLARFDADRDGRLDPAEWDRARAAARQQVIEGMLEQPSAAQCAVLAQPKDGRAFLLSASDGQSLARRLRRRAAAGLAASAASSAALLWMARYV